MPTSRFVSGKNMAADHVREWTLLHSTRLRIQHRFFCRLCRRVKSIAFDEGERILIMSFVKISHADRGRCHSNTHLGRYVKRHPPLQMKASSSGNEYQYLTLTKHREDISLWCFLFRIIDLEQQQ